MSRRQIQTTAIALEDIGEHVGYIALDDPLAARTLLSEFARTFNSLASFPMMGTLRFSETEELTAVRSFVMAKPFTSYIILYHPLAEGVRVLRVLHNSRDNTGLPRPNSC